MPEKSEFVSVCIIAKNCADTLPVTLTWALDNFEEINLVVDPNNEDSTRSVVRSFDMSNGEIHVKLQEFDNFSAQKNRAFAMATRPWVLSVDSDELYEIGTPWDKLTKIMERTKNDAASFNLYNLQADVRHFLPPILPKVRLMRSDIAMMDGKLVDEGLNFRDAKIVHFDYAHIHLGHIRPREALKLKGQDRIKFKDQDPCDGPGMIQHGVDWFINRNESWNQRAIRVPQEVDMTMDTYAKGFLDE